MNWRLITGCHQNYGYYLLSEKVTLYQSRPQETHLSTASAQTAPTWFASYCLKPLQSISSFIHSDSRSSPSANITLSPSSALFDCHGKITSGFSSCLRAVDLFLTKPTWLFEEVCLYFHGSVIFQRKVSLGMHCLPLFRTYQELLWKIQNIYPWSKNRWGIPWVFW